jgi:hypothetical protein
MMVTLYHCRVAWMLQRERSASRPRLAARSTTGGAAKQPVTLACAPPLRAEDGSRSGRNGFRKLAVTAMTLCAVASRCLAEAADNQTAEKGAAAKPLAKSSGKAASTTLFLTWENVFRGRMEPMIDPARVSPEGQKALEGLQKSWNRQFKTNGHGTEMFFAPRGIRITIEKARKEILPLKPDRLWEENLHSLSIIQEKQRLRCWYAANIPKQKQTLGFQNERAIESGGSAICYAESTNGFDWVKPNLGVCTFSGSKHNNIVSYSYFIGSVFYDENGPAEERYKSFEFGKLPAAELENSKGGNFNTYCLYALVSPDGYRWRSMTNPLVRHFCDTQNVGAWDPVLKKYVGYFRDHQTGRAISRAETTNFHSWPEPRPLLVPGPEDSPDIDYYSNGYTTYPGRPALRLLFPAIYHQAADTVDVRLAVSLEGRAYNWVSHEPIIELGRPGEWDGGQVYASPNLIRLADNRLALPFGGHAETHNEGYFPQFYKSYSRQSGFGWAVWDDGRLAGIEADGEGEFYTHPLRPEGDQLEINARAKPGGSIRFELCENGEPIKGFSLADSVPFTADAVWAPVRWKDKDNVSELAGRKTQLHVSLSKAKIFGYRITAETPARTKE